MWIGSRKRWAVGAVVFFSLLLGALFFSPSPGDRDEEVAGRSRKTAPPNILIFVTDDQPAASLAAMPETRRWFERGGVEFSPGFVTTPLCCPSRASIFTGRYAHNHGVLDNSQPLKLDQSSTIQRYLAERGYWNAIFGKFLNYWPVSKTPPYFHRWATFRGFPYDRGDWNINGRLSTVPTYSTTFISRLAQDFLAEADRSDDARPWFLYLAPVAPHSPYKPESKYLDAAVPAFSGNPAVRERDKKDKPPYLRMKGSSLARARETHDRQLRTLMSVDDMVGKLFRQLGVLGERRRTLAFFISDNGYMWGEHGVINKTLPHTPSITVPFLMTWPERIVGGSTDGRLAANVDIAPTVLEAAGISPDPAAPLDGKSLLSDWRRTRLLTEYYFYRRFTTPSWASTRTKDYQYIEYFQGGRVSFREYYDLKRDPWQLVNVLQDGVPSNDPDVDRLHRRLAADRSCVGPSCP